MARNLKYQFKYAVESAFREGQDKHSMKHTGGIGKGNVYSYADRKALIDFSANLANYMQSNYPEVKMARDVNSTHIQGFLNSKAESCTNATINQYIAKVNKLNTLLEQRYNTNIGFNRELVKPISHEQTAKLRDIAMSRVDYNKIEKAICDSRSAGKTAFELAGKFGLRAAETVKVQKRDIDLDKRQLSIVDSKGGKDRVVEIKEKDMSYMKALKDSLAHENSRAVPIKESSAQEFLRREMKKLTLENDYSGCKTSFHAIRKMAAQERYDQNRADGMSREDAWSRTSVWLGHGADRMDLFTTYVQNRK